MGGRHGRHPSVPGCHTAVPVVRPPGVPYHVDRGRGARGRDRCTIRVGLVIVHECVLCVDGIWR